MNPEKGWRSPGEAWGREMADKLTEAVICGGIMMSHSIGPGPQYVFHYSEIPVEVRPHQTSQTGDNHGHRKDQSREMSNNSIWSMEYSDMNTHTYIHI